MEKTMCYTEELRKFFDEELRKFFDNQGITQKAIAQRMNLNPAYINKLLNGKKAFGRNTAKQFQDLYGCVPWCRSSPSSAWPISITRTRRQIERSRAICTI
jgi:transcriptional regulator with XRE-family HTH domain